MQGDLWPEMLSGKHTGHFQETSSPFLIRYKRVLWETEIRRGSRYEEEREEAKEGNWQGHILSSSRILTPPSRDHRTPVFLTLSQKTDSSFLL